VERSRILLSTQRALLGMVTKNMVAITIGYKQQNSFVLRIYFEKDPSSGELELMSEITSEIAADFEEIDCKEEHLIFDGKENLLCLDDWVYLRSDV
jgi:hypothetical protein